MISETEQAGYDAGAAAAKKRIKQRLPLGTARPPQADYRAHKDSWDQYLAGWSRAIRESANALRTWSEGESK